MVSQRRQRGCIRVWTRAPSAAQAPRARIRSHGNAVELSLYRASSQVAGVPAGNESAREEKADSRSKPPRLPGTMPPRWSVRRALSRRMRARVGRLARDITCPARKTIRRRPRDGQSKTAFSSVNSAKRASIERPRFRKVQKRVIDAHRAAMLRVPRVRKSVAQCHDAVHCELPQSHSRQFGARCGLLSSLRKRLACWAEASAETAHLRLFGSGVRGRVPSAPTRTSTKPQPHGGPMT